MFVLYSLLYLFLLPKFKFKFKFEKSFFNLEIINEDMQLIPAASVNSLTEAGGFSQPPRLKS
jgi:hypothetical protein